MNDFPASDFTKPALRRMAQARRSQLPMAEISRKICLNIAAAPFFLSAGRILAYHPFRSEVDLLPLTEAHLNKRWYLPVTGPDVSMTFHPYQPEYGLNAGRYGIQEPTRQHDADHVITPETIRPDDLILLPGLLFDRAGYRIGYGKGYFDRFLGQAALSGKRCVTVGAVPEVLLTDKLPRDSWDVPANWLVTEQVVLEAFPG